MSKNYILEGKNPVIETDLMTWARWFEKADRVVAKSQIDTGEEVSTVFLGIDHRFGDGPPLLFETMVFGGNFSDEQHRYSTWGEAEKGHIKVVRAIMAGF